MLTGHEVREGTDDCDAVRAVRQLAEEDKVAIGRAAAQLACLIEANYPGLDSERIESLAIDFAYRLLVAQRHS